MEKDYPEELALFQSPSKELAVQKIQFVEYRPVGQLNTGPLEFQIPATANQYLDLFRSRLCLKVKIVKGDGSAIGTDDRVAPANLVMHSLFNQVDVLVQQQLVSSTGSQAYGYKAYIEALLQQSREVQESFLQQQGFYKDTTPFMESMAPSLAGNRGWTTRYMIFAEDAVVDLEGPLFSDIFQQRRSLINGIELQVKMWSSKPEFALCSATAGADYKPMLMEACLKICKITPIPAVLLAHSQILQDHPALYPYTRTQIKTYQLPKGSFGFHFEDLYQSEVPSQLIMGLVDAKAYTGEYSTNPYHFKQCDLRTVGLYLDDESVPSRPLKIDYAQMNYQEAYSSLFDGDGTGPNISREDYPAGYSLISFKLAPDNIPFTGRGNVRLSGSFGTPLAENTILLIYGKFQAELKIDAARNVLT